MLYWLMLILLIIFQISQKKKNTFYLKLGFYIFLIGSILRLITLVDIAEVFMRISFVLFVMGLVLSYLEGGVANKPK